VVRMWLRARVVAVVAAACCVAGGVVAGAPAVPAAGASAGAVYVPVGPVRVLDTRNGTGHSGALGANASFSLQVTGNNGVSSGATAVVLNVTATGPTASSFVTVYPDLTTRPASSSLNFTAGETIPNLVTVPLGSDGAVDFYNHTGSVNLVADLAGYYTTSGSGSLLASTGPVRVLDTRNGTGGFTAPVGANSAISLQVTGNNGVPPARVTAVVLNVTATDPTASSFVTVYPGGTTRPSSSSLNFTAGETIPNLVIVPVGSDGKVDFYNHAGSVNLVADLTGYFYAAGAQYNPLGPVRVLDTRTGPTAQYTTPLMPNSTFSLQLTGKDGVPVSGVTAVVLNVTAVGPTASGYVTVWPDGQPRPTTSSLNFAPGETIANLVVVPVGADGKVDFYNPMGSVNLVADLAGYYAAGGAPWGNAIEVPGTALDTGGADVASLSCPSAGNCAAGGSYDVSSSSPIYQPQAFVADEVNGTWRNAIEVPGTAALNTGNAAGVNSVSCASAANCAAGGYYSDSSGNDQAFVASEVNGTWGTAIEVPGTAALNIGTRFAVASVYSVSCGSAGNCAAAGTYKDSSGQIQAFVSDEVNGTWGTAIEVPGTAALNTGGAAEVQSVSCASAGNCAAAGSYTDSSGHSQAFVADEVSGTWGTAIEVPGTAAVSTGSSANVIQVISVSCASAGNCAAGGDYTDSSGHSQAFVADEVNGTWGDAIQVPGTAALNTGNAYVFSVSCPSAGNCSAGGEYSLNYSSPTGEPSSEPFVVSEVNGTWGDAIEVPATAANALSPALVTSVSCGSPGNCAAGGYYTNSSEYYYAFVVSEVHGVWGEAIQVPGTTILGYVSSVSCPATGSCVAGGYADISGPVQAFVVGQN
jgi:hypothetical protein